jgi:hypothetical protein
MTPFLAVYFCKKLIIVGAAPMCAPQRRLAMSVANALLGIFTRADTQVCPYCLQHFTRKTMAKNGEIRSWFKRLFFDSLDTPILEI